MVDKYTVMFWTACRRRICWSGQDVGLNGDDLGRMEEETEMFGAGCRKKSDNMVTIDYETVSF